MQESVDFLWIERQAMSSWNLMCRYVDLLLNEFKQYANRLSQGSTVMEVGDILILFFSTQVGLGFNGCIKFGAHEDQRPLYPRPFLFEISEEW